MANVELRDLDRGWRQQMRGRSLATEAGIDPEVAIAGLRTLLDHLRYEPAAERTRMLRSYAPTVIAGLTSIAATKYEDGTFWPFVAESTGVPCGQVQQQELSDAFRHGLRLLGLSQFDTPMRNVGEILMHGGIAASSLLGILRFARIRAGKGRGEQGNDFCAWATNVTSDDAARKGIDAPTFRFLAYGGEIAADLIDRILDAAETTSEDPAGLIHALPRHLGNEIIRLRAAGELSQEHRSRRKRGQRSPRFILQQGEVLLELPPYAAILERSITWSISTDGEVRKRNFPAPWPGDVPSPAMETVSQPTRDIVVSIEDSELEWTVSLFDHSVALLTFDAQSRELIPSANLLPKSRVWLVFPNSSDDSLEESLEVEGDLTVIESTDAPYGWDGWTFVLVDASRALRLRKRKDGDAAPWRYVSAVTRPTMRDTPLLEGVRDPQGNRALARRPSITLPRTYVEDGSSSASTEWNVTTADAHGTVVFHEVYHVGEMPQTIYPWPPQAAELIGEYTITAQGPLGRGAQFEFLLVEATQITTDITFRWFQPGGGLEPCVISVNSPQTRFAVNLDSLTRDHVISLPASAGGAVHLQSDVDSMWVTVSDDSEEGPRGTGPAQLERESIHEQTLRLNTIPNARGHIEVLAAGTVIQSLGIGANSTGIALLKLDRIADTAAKFGSVSVRYSAVGRSALIALVRPRELLTDVELYGDSLLLTLTAEETELELGVYLDYAPWQPPAVINVSPSKFSAQLPSDSLGSGPITILVRARDPWMAQPWPKVPSLSAPNTFHFARPITTEDPFVLWVSETESLAKTTATLISALERYLSLGSVRGGRSRSALVSDVARLTLAPGIDFLSAARSVAWDAGVHTRVLVEGWASTAPASSWAVNYATWKVSPFLGLLESAGAWSASYERLQGVLTSTLGDTAREILTERIDSHAGVGRFSQEAEIMAGFPLERLNSLWSASNTTPGPFLAKDQRALHARALFDARLSPRTRGFSEASNVVLRNAHVVLKQAVGERFRVPVGARAGADGWPSLPCISLSLALVARLTARGDVDAGAVYDRYRTQFADLAEDAPGFVEQDLVLAELWMMRWEMK